MLGQLKIVRLPLVCECPLYLCWFCVEHPLKASVEAFLISLPAPGSGPLAPPNALGKAMGKQLTSGSLSQQPPGLCPWPFAPACEHKSPHSSVPCLSFPSSQALLLLCWEAPFTPSTHQELATPHP